MFLAFAFQCDRPLGGEGDFEGAFSTFDAAKEAAIAAGYSNAQVYDVAKGRWHEFDH